ncbi:hypothetical protein [Streptomyces sp. H27-C3]|uniref:hypothetical protein n=1 Tax=Streptomyces sp. H27-C3 TaxID=3046305 RepID=UPI0024BB5B9C|nr:hypothetical protein [Streptomyces sp. H27-C3]MDJ0466694.1 hypothetical protein [Streptomyces sp. H27-C3]
MSNQQPYPYEGQEGREGHDGRQDQSYGQRQSPYAQQQPPYAQESYTQTWEGQTWDAQYQPVQPQAQQDRQQPQPQPDRQQPYAQPDAYGQQYRPQAPAPAAADTAYPPPHRTPGPEPYEPAQAAYEPPPAPAPYEPPTTLGNTRVTDAQRARAEGRSPVIAPGMQPAALTAALALLMAAAAGLGSYALVVPLVLLQAVTAGGWFRLNGMWPARQGIMLAFLGGITADIALLAVDAAHAPAAIIGTLGVWVLLTLVLQLRNRAPADERMYGLTATVTSAALAVVAAGHLAAAPEAVTIGGAAVAVAVLARAVPLGAVPSVIVSLLAAAGAGIATGQLTDVGSKGALLGLAAGVCALIGLRVASYDYPSRFVHMTAGVALPLTVAAPAVYLIGRAIV